MAQDSALPCFLWSIFSVALLVGAITFVYAFAPHASDKTKIFVMISIGTATAPFVEILCRRRTGVFVDLGLAYCAYLVILLAPSYVLSGYKLGFINYFYATPMTTLVFPLYVMYYFLNYIVTIYCNSSPREKP